MTYNFKDLMALGPEATARDGYYRDWTHIDADTFHQISELVKFIREKGYGADTREAMAQALERVYHDAMKSGNADMELSMARKHFKDLASRLDASDDELTSATAQLEQKADKGALAQVAISKRDKEVEIEMKDLSQEVKESMTGGSVAVVGSDSVGTTNLKNKSVTNDKITSDLLANTPWKNTPEDDVDYIVDEGHFLIGSVVKNNPIQTTTLLSNKRAKTTSTNNLAWITQTVTEAVGNNDKTIYVRQIQFNTTTQSLSFKGDWKRILNEDDLESINLKNLTERGIYLENEDYDLNDYLENGTYIVGSPALNNPFNSGSSILENVTGKISLGATNHWVQQTLTNFHGGKVKTYKRIIFINGSQEIGYIMGWTKVLDEDDLKLVNPWFGKQWVAVGTSMTASEGNYTQTVSDILGLQLDNRGVGSGGLTSSAYVGDTTMQAIETLEDFDGLLTIEAGPNDGGHPLGELGDTDKTTFYGCLYHAFNEATKRTSARKVVLTMTNQWADTQTTDRRETEQQFMQFGQRAINMQRAIIEMAGWFSFPVIDIKGESGLGGYHLNEHTSRDWIHFTSLGGQIAGEYVAKQLQNRIQPFPDELKLYNEA